ncbi:MAG: AAA family ATPase [Methanobacteriaceae archaeon]|nr:AAA family ATPase [Methanobacteriaceae archaeon]
MNIGLVYVKGSVPAFENFGNLPTKLVKETGLVDGKKAHKELDGLIIPGGSIVESQSISKDLAQEILKMEQEGSFILGMCSGFQVLANKTDIGRKSPLPIERKGLGILDVSFSPMISNDRVEAEVVGRSFFTRGVVNKIVTGFHCHTYGKIEGEAPKLFFSRIRRKDYQDNPSKILSGVQNDDGNVVGTMIHGCLDENPILVKNILKYLGADEEDLIKIRKKNKILIKRIKREIGIDYNIYASDSPNYIQKINSKQNLPPALMMVSTGSDSGKTFLTTGIVGNLRKKGYRVCVLKVGPDIRDIVPSLYLNKENMEPFSSIKIGQLGWMELKSVLNQIKTKNYDLIIIEGVMSAFTGLLNEKTPFSTVEIAKAANIPVILVSSSNKGGIETAAVDIASHADLMGKMGVEVGALILNKVYDESIAKFASHFLKNKVKTDNIWSVPKIKLTERGNIPEVEIKLEDFCLCAMKTVEKYLNIEDIINVAKKPTFTGYLSHKSILNFFQ